MVRPSRSCRLWTAGAAIALLAGATPAHAAFIFQQSQPASASTAAAPAAPPEATSSTSPMTMPLPLTPALTASAMEAPRPDAIAELKVRLKGTPRRVNAAAHRMPIDAVLKMIVPSSVHLAPLPANALFKTLTFAGHNRPWPDVLIGALTSAGLTAAMDSQGRLIISVLSPSLAQVAPPAASTATSPTSPVPAPPAQVTGPESPRTSFELTAWVVRGAVSGRAWVVQPGQEGLGPIEIKQGDEHPILGRILSVTLEKNRWVVSTARGWFAGGPS